MEFDSLETCRIFLFYLSAYRVSLFRHSVVNPSYSSKINGYLYFQRVSLLLKKKTSIQYVLRMDVWRTFLTFELARSGVQIYRNGRLELYKFEKIAQIRHFYLQRAVNVTAFQITHQNCLQRAGWP
jgi:hypothetical protein